ncbi:MAG: acetyl-CoA carboxylase biotin carboxyl carrier protein [Candidatus Binatia bacterium]
MDIGAFGAGLAYELEGDVTELTEDEVLQILDLIEKSSFDFMELQMGDLRLTVSKGGTGGSTPDKPALEASADSEISTRPEPKVSKAQADKEGDRPFAKPKKGSIKEGTVPIAAPMLGTFYITPEPGAPPFVKEGGLVDEDTTVGLIEVMKVFNAVKSGVRGVVAEICVQSGQFVEYGQTLFLVNPEGRSVGKGPPG